MPGQSNEKYALGLAGSQPAISLKGELSDHKGHFDE
jgi:hypothetical protein